MCGYKILLYMIIKSWNLLWMTPEPTSNTMLYSPVIFCVRLYVKCNVILEINVIDMILLTNTFQLYNCCYENIGHMCTKFEQNRTRIDNFGKLTFT